MTYNAVVTKIAVRPHPNADAIQLGTCRGNQVVVGLDTKTGDLGAFFVTDGQLSESFATANNLLAIHDATGKKVGGGFFDKNRRVRAQKFRGERSDGFWVPLSFFNYLGNISALVEGFEFSELNGHPICNKYVTESTARAILNQKAQPRKANVMFAKHTETEKWRDRSDRIPDGALIILSEKLHGSSHRVGRVLRQRVETGWRKALFGILNKMGIVRKSEWVVVHGTRNVVLNDELTDLYYGTDFRANATRFLESNLRKGEVVYGEIVGYSAPGAPVMNPQDTKGLKDKEITKRYGSLMIYTYGQPDDTCKFYVYRITRVNEDGDAVDLSWAQVKARCNELGASYVPEYAPPFIFDGNRDALANIVETIVDGDSLLCDKHIREGVCVRVEHESGFFTLKNKSFNFGLLEGYLKERTDLVDAEESA